MGRLKLIIKQGSNFSIELYSDNQNNSLLNLHIMYLQPIITQYFASNKSEIWP